MMTIRTPRGRNHGFATSRQRILDTARGIMREEGVGALTLHEVARRVGMRTPSLYTYFESKHALYDAIFRLGLQQYRAELDALEAGLAGAGGPEHIEAVLRHYLRFADDYPELYALVFERPVPGFEPSPESMAEAQALLAESQDRVQSLLDSGALVSGLPAAQTRDLLVVVMHGLASLKRANEPEAPPGEGRFGPLVPHAIALLTAAWSPVTHGAEEEATP